MLSRLLLFSVCVCVFWLPSSQAGMIFDSERHRFTAEVIADQLRHPWSVAFLPDEGLLITERGGRLLLKKSHAATPEVVAGLPAMTEHGQGGLMDVILDPRYRENRHLYLSYIGREGNRFGTEVLRAELRGQSLHKVEIIFRMSTKTNSGRHFGSRLLFARDGSLFISLGDRGDRPRAQDRMDHAGSLIRIHKDGSVPEDNPWVSDTSALPELYTWGNRNIQGMAMDPNTGQIYTHEHGPQGGDELNLMHPGANYGWPEISYGKEYVTHFDIGEGTVREDVQGPLHYWIPSIAPSGMSFYTGKEFPAWQGQLFIGSLKFGELVRLELKNGQIVHEERMLDNRLGRIRDVRQGPDGTLYLLTDAREGQLLRLKQTP